MICPHPGSCSLPVGNRPRAHAHFSLDNAVACEAPEDQVPWSHYPRSAKRIRAHRCLHTSCPNLRIAGWRPPARWCRGRADVASAGSRSAIRRIEARRLLRNGVLGPTIRVPVLRLFPPGEPERAESSLAVGLHETPGGERSAPMASHHHAGNSSCRNRSKSTTKRKTPRGITDSLSVGTGRPTAQATLLVVVLALSATMLSTPRSLVAGQYEGSVFVSASIQSEDHSMRVGGLGMAMGSLDVAQRLGVELRMGVVEHKYFAAGDELDRYVGGAVGLMWEFNLAGRFSHSQRFRLYLLAGPTLAYSKRQTADLEDDKRFDAALTSGVGMNVPLAEPVALTVGWEYYLGILQHEPYNRDSAGMLRIGLRFRGA